MRSERRPIGPMVSALFPPSGASYFGSLAPALWACGLAGGRGCIAVWDPDVQLLGSAMELLPAYRGFVRGEGFR